MRILIVGINYHPELTGIGKYTGEMSEWLASRGCAVRVVTAPPHYPMWRVAPGYRRWAYARGQLNRVRVWRCPLWVPRTPNGAFRLLHLGSFALSSLPVALWHGLIWRPDVVFAVAPPVMAAPGAWAAARLGGARAWLHVQDFEVDAAFDLGLLRSKALRRFVAGAERWLLRRFDRVSTISERMVERLRAKGLKPSGEALFPNWVDTEEIRPVPVAGTLRREIGIPETGPVLLYSGNMGHKQGLELLVDMIGRLPPELGALLVLCGDGTARPSLEKLAEGLPNVRFAPLQPQERLNDLLNIADVHLLPQRAEAEDLVMPSKLTAMLASGHPVVATAAPGTEIARVLAGRGVVVAPGNLEELTSAVTSLLVDPAWARALGNAGRGYAITHWSKEKVLQAAFPNVESVCMG